MGREVVQVLAGVVEAGDLGGLGEAVPGQGPDPFRAVADDDQLADGLGAAAPRFGGGQGAEGLGGGEAGQVAGRGGVLDGRPFSSRLVWVNRQASFTSRVWARPSSALPGRPAVSAGVIGTPVPSTSM